MALHKFFSCKHWSYNFVIDTIFNFKYSKLMVGLMATSGRACTRGHLPGLLLPGAPSRWQATTNPCLYGRPSNTRGDTTWSLVWEDLICCKTTKPLPHNYWAHMLHLGLCTLEPVSHNKRSHGNEKPCTTRRESWFTATRESPHAEATTQHSQKSKTK